MRGPGARGEATMIATVPRSSKPPPPIRGSVFVHARAIAHCTHTRFRTCLVDLDGSMTPARLCIGCGAMQKPDDLHWTRPELCEELVGAIAS